MTVYMHVFTVKGIAHVDWGALCRSG